MTETSYILHEGWEEKACTNEHGVLQNKKLIIIIITTTTTTNSILYYLCAKLTAARPITDTA
jgi:hypothetical protein